MFDYVLAGLAMIACCGFCIATIKGFEPIIDNMPYPWQVVACAFIGWIFGLFAVYLMIEAVK